MIDFGTALRAARKKAGFRQQIDLSRASGVSQATISRLEDGISRPTTETLAALAKALDISTDVLMQAAGYLDSEREPINSYLDSECRRLLAENAKLHEENANLKAAIKNLTRGW